MDLSIIIGNLAIVFAQFFPEMLQNVCCSKHCYKDVIIIKYIGACFNYVEIYFCKYTLTIVFTLLRQKTDIISTPTIRELTIIYLL